MRKPPVDVKHVLMTDKNERTDYKPRICSCCDKTLEVGDTFILSQCMSFKIDNGTVIKSHNFRMCTTCYQLMKLFVNLDPQHNDPKLIGEVKTEHPIHLFTYTYIKDSDIIHIIKFFNNHFQHEENK